MIAEGFFYCLFCRKDIFDAVHGYSFYVLRAVEGRKQLADFYGETGGFYISAVGGGLRHLTREGGGCHLSARHAVNCVVYKNNGYVFVPRGGVHGFCHSDGREVAVALICEDYVIGVCSFQPRCDCRSASVGGFRHVAGEIVVCHNGAPDGGNAYCSAFDSERVYRFGDKAVYYSVCAAGAVVQRHIGKAFRFFKNGHD